MPESSSSFPTRRRRKRRGRKTSSAPPPPSSGSAVGGSKTGGKKTPPRLPPGVQWTIGLLFASILGAYLYLSFVYPSARGPGSGRDVEIVLPGDDSNEALAGRLAAAGLVQSPRLFMWYLRVTGGATKVAPGVHLLSDELSPGEIMSRLERKGRAARVKVVIPEGWNRFDIGKRLQSQHVCTQKAFVEATKAPSLLAELRIEGDSAEGFLFPATYEWSMDSDAAEIVRRMKGEFDKRWASIEQAHASGMLDLGSTLGWGKREIVTLASMVEKEAAVDEERPIIASVFLNRLRDPNFKRKVLQSDPTSGYGCLVMRDQIPACQSYAGKITHDINVDPANAYSTYVHEKLPPTPIANPGAKSMAAVLSPAMTRYLFFVARGEGRHTFSETLEAHNAAVKGEKPGEKTGEKP